MVPAVAASMLVALSSALFIGRANAQAKTATATTLTITSSGKTVSTVTSGSVVRLTAHVTAGSTGLTPGQVNFCDASAVACSDIHLLGTAQLTAGGTATFSYRPGIGSHQYKAVFLGTKAYASSASAIATLSATGTIPQLAASTTISQAGGWGSYALSSTVTETGNTAPPTGTVSFLDTNHANAVLGSGPLGAATRGAAWSVDNSNAPNFAAVISAIADLNGDGIPDIFAQNYYGTYATMLGKGDGTFIAGAAPFGPSTETGNFALGDFNNDGIVDVAAINAVYYAPTASVTIFLGKGDGTFTVGASSPALGTNPTGIGIADLDGDGNADLAVGQTDASGNGQLLVFLGKGDGTFATTPIVNSVSSIDAVVTPADLNNDGKMDIVMSGNGGAIILLGKGDGTFTASSTSVSAGEAPVLVADVNKDGIPDLLFDSVATSTLSVLLGNGDGTFDAAPAGPNVNSPSGALAIGDLNQDGVPDLLYENATGTGVNLLFGNGDGTFTPNLSGGAIYGYDLNQLFLVADVNGDGWPDVVSMNRDTVNVAMTQPTETASASATVSIALPGSHLAAASYAGNPNYKTGTSTTLPLWGDPVATVTALTVTSAGKPVTSVSPGSQIALTATVTSGGSAVASGQVNFCDASAASCSDVHLLGTAALASNGTAVLQLVPGAGTYSYKAVFVQDGYGLTSSSAAASLSVGPAPAPVYADTATISSDGYPGQYSLTATIVGFGGTVAPTGTVSFLDTSFGNASLGTAPLKDATPGIGWLVSQPTIPGARPGFEKSGDFNGDGIPDLALVTTDSTYNGPPYSVTILTGKGDGTFSIGATTLLPATASVVDVHVGDFNQDGKQDLVVLTDFSSQQGSTVISLVGNGDGTFTLSKPSTVSIPEQGGGDVIQPTMVSGDFNGDGKLDLGIVGNYIYGGVAILLGNGDGTFTATATNPEQSRGLGMIAVGDFNGDHILDLVVSDYFAGSSTNVLIGKGDGTFAPPGAAVTTENFLRSAVVGDFNSDGKADLALGLNGGVLIYLGKGDGTFTQPAGSPFSGSGYALHVGDFNHDGKADLATIDSYHQTAAILLGGGDGTFKLTTTNLKGSLSAGAPAQLASDDFNHDGVPDLALLSVSGGAVSILLTEPTETVAATIQNVAPVGAGTHSVKASYPGDQNYPSVQSGTIVLDAGLAPLTITPAGGTYSSSQTVTISEAIPGATIYYAASGTFNTNGVVEYKGPITLDAGGPETISAYATETGYQQSNQTTVSFLMNLPVAPTPVISPAGGVSNGAQSVTITDTAPTARIYYTTDGSLPTTSSAVYSGPISITGTTTVAAIAAGGGYSASPAATAQFFVQSSVNRYIYTVAGTGFWGTGGDGHPATIALMNEPSSTAIDAKGNLYIADSANETVRKVDASTGNISTVAGNGTFGYSGDGGPATSATFDFPYALAFDAQGNLYISDSGNYAVRRVDAASGIITTVAGNGTPGSIGDGGAATKAEFNYLQGIAIDATGNLYIGDGPRVRMVNAKTGIITTVAGGLSGGYTGDGGPATSARLEETTGIAVDASGNFYVADDFSNVVRKVTVATGIISTVAGSNTVQNEGYAGDGGPATSARLASPRGVTLDASGNIYIADTLNSTIREVTVADGKINTIAGLRGYCTTLSGDGGPATESGLCYPTGVSVDGANNVYVTEQSFNRIRKVVPATNPPSTTTAQPRFSIAAGSYPSPQTLAITDATPGAEIYVSINGAQTLLANQSYASPITISGSAVITAQAVAPGNLPSAVTSASYIITTPPAKIIDTIAGNGDITPVGIGGAATSAGIGQPYGVAVDASNNVYFADNNNPVVWKVSGSTGKITAAAGIPGTFSYPMPPGPATSTALENPRDVAIDPAGNLYIGDTGFSEVLKVDAKTGIMTVYAGGANFAQPTNGDGGPATDAYLLPTGLAFDHAGNLYISDSYNGLIRKVTAATGIITTVAGGGTKGDGNGGPATSAELYYPGPLAFDRKGNLYFGEGDRGRVRVINATTGIISTYAGSGIAGASGDGGPALQAQLSASGLAFDAADNLYISNWFDGVRMVPAGGGNIDRVVGLAYYGFEGDGAASTMAELCDPNGIAFDSAGSLYIADSCNARVRKVFVSGSTAAPTFTPPAGTYNAAQTVTISDATPVAAIYYTTDGSTPTTGSTLYTQPLAVTSSETLQAIAIAKDYSASAVSSAAYVIVPQAAATISAVTSSANPSLTGSAVTFTVSVSSNAGTPTGSVAFMDGSTQLGTVSLSGTSASYTTSSLAAGSHSITAVYSGDSNFAAVTSSALTQTVVSFSITIPGSGSTTATTSPGGQATYSLSATPPATGAGLTFSVTGLPTGASATFSPSTVAAGAGATTVTMTVAVPTKSAALDHQNKSESQPLTLAFVLFLAPLAYRHRKRWRGILSMIAVGAILGLGLTACGGSGKQTSPTQPTQQTYNLTVTATSGTLTQSTKVTLIVQ